MEKKSFNVRFIVKEKILRTQMTNLYLSVMAHQNAATLINAEPSLINLNVAKGNHITRQSLVDLSRWLEFLKGMASSNDAFSAQILAPIRRVCNFALEIEKKTTKLCGWVFAKSKPYEDSFSEQKRVTISMLVPDLYAVMSIRCQEEEAKNIGYGMHEFGEIKPLPLVNRFHQFHPSYKEIDSKLTLADCDFLKTSLDDLESFNCSLEMEHYCEVASTQSKKRQLLGAVLVVGGKVVSVDYPSIWIQNVIGPSHEFEFLVSEHLDKNLGSNEIEEFQNKMVRVLCVTWYNTGMEIDSHPKIPEAVFIEEVQEKSDLVADDIVGTVRLRNRISKAQLSKRYPGVDFSKIPGLEEQNGEILMSENLDSADPVIDKFLKTTNQIREMRRHGKPSNRILLVPEDVLDNDKGSIHTLSRKREVTDILLELLEKIDFTGQTVFEKLPVDDKTIRRSKLWFLENLGLILKKDGKIRVSKKGIEVAYLSQKKRIAEIVSGYKTKGILSIPDLEGNQVLPSFLVKYFKGQENNAFRNSSIDGTVCNLFWFCTSSDDTPENRQKIRNEIERLSLPIREQLAGVRHPLPKSGICDELMQGKFRGMSPPYTATQKHLSYYSAQSIMSLLEAQGIVKSDGEHWEYSLLYRVADFLSAHPQQVFSARKIADKIIFPRPEHTDAWGLTEDMKTRLVEKELQKLDSKNKVAQIGSDLWTLNGDADFVREKCKSFLKDQLRNVIVEALKTFPRPIPEARLLGFLGLRARQLCEKTVFSGNWEAIQNETMDSMTSKKMIVFEDEVFRRGESWEFSKKKFGGYNFQECPQCHVRAEGLDELERIFGLRKMHQGEKTMHPQSNCKKCRARYAKKTDEDSTDPRMSSR